MEPPPGPLLLSLYVLWASLRSILSLAVDLLGLGDLVSEDPDFLGPTSWSEHILHLAEGDDDGAAAIRLTRCRPRPAPAALVRELLPASTYGDDDDEEDPAAAAGCCTVCLCELRRGDEVRRPRGCRHVFHRRCLDPWVDLGRRTCPLCRAPLVPSAAAAAELGGACAAAVVDTDRYDYSIDDFNTDVDGFGFGFYPLGGDPSDMPSSLALFLLAPPTQGADTIPVADKNPDPRIIRGRLTRYRAVGGGGRFTPSNLPACVF